MGESLKVIKIQLPSKWRYFGLIKEFPHNHWLEFFRTSHLKRPSMHLPRNNIIHGCSNCASVFEVLVRFPATKPISLRRKIQKHSPNVWVIRSKAWSLIGKGPETVPSSYILSTSRSFLVSTSWISLDLSTYSCWTYFLVSPLAVKPWSGLLLLLDIMRILVELYLVDTE